MMNADQYEKRWEAVRRVAQPVVLDFDQLQKWGTDDRNRINFEWLGVEPFDFRRRKLIRFNDVAGPAALEYVRLLVARGYEAQLKAIAKYDCDIDIDIDIGHPNALMRIAGDIADRLERRILNAVFDGDLGIYSGVAPYEQIDLATVCVSHAANK